MKNHIRILLFELYKSHPNNEAEKLENTYFFDSEIEELRETLPPDPLALEVGSDIWQLYQTLHKISR